MALSSDSSSKRSKFMSSLLNIHPRDSLQMGKILVSKSKKSKSGDRTQVKILECSPQALLSVLTLSSRRESVSLCVSLRKSSLVELKHVDSTENSAGSLSTSLPSLMRIKELLYRNGPHSHTSERWCTHVRWLNRSCQWIWGLCWHQGGELRTSPWVSQPGCGAVRQCTLRRQKHVNTDLYKVYSGDCRWTWSNPENRCATIVLRSNCCDR